MPQHVGTARPPADRIVVTLVDDEVESLLQLRGDCARMAPRWTASHRAAETPVPPSRIHGVVVTPAAARLLDAMSDYGD
ncbi:hypothetical protein [Streptomyces meridianus]|uniref:Uncharacterized protein n=1 Tax=Streptomyces meridianus TaxID=2938945 RepID=A0ABT0X1P0_9ACTN|nr:hypothetical protein [Streptomyces meridianus]MCM2576389.1 hypothetical protein [Streptomyces meridianus]